MLLQVALLRRVGAHFNRFEGPKNSFSNEDSDIFISDSFLKCILYRPPPFSCMTQGKYLTVLCVTLLTCQIEYWYLTRGAITRMQWNGLVSPLGDNLVKVILSFTNWQLSNLLYQLNVYVAHKHDLLLWFCSERLSKLTALFVTGIRLVAITSGPVGLDNSLVLILGTNQSCSLTSVQVAAILFPMK